MNLLEMNLLGVDQNILNVSFIYLFLMLNDSAMSIAILKQSNEIELSDGEKKVRIKIEHQLMRILVLLTESKGELVDKKIFIDKIWDGNNLTGEGALIKNIFKLREVFKNNNLDQMIRIETIPKKGYRLLMNEHQEETKKRPGNKKIVLAAATALAVLSFLFFIYRSTQHTADTFPLIHIIGQDTIIQLGKKKVEVITIDTNADKVIRLGTETK